MMAPERRKAVVFALALVLGVLVMAGGTSIPASATDENDPDSLFLPVIVGSGEGGTLRPTAQPTGTRTPIPTETPEPTPHGMILIPAGEFQMGCDINTDPYGCDIWGDMDQLPLHKVSLSAYWIDKYEVTNARYQACVDAGVCAAPGHTFSNTRHSYYGNPTYAEYPVIFVSWEKAKTFCDWEGKRLPTEAEWEKAARGSTGTRAYPWGDAEPVCDLANFQDCFQDSVGDTSAVGSHPAGASPYGAMDMGGNVFEWVNDWYSEDYYASSPENNPTGPVTGTFRVERGGSWFYASWSLRAAYRDFGNVEDEGSGLGFRCARSE